MTTSALALELSCRYLAPLIELAEAERVPLSDLLDGFDVNEAQLRDLTNWVSLNFCETFTDRLAARVGPSHLVRSVVAASYSPRALGFLYPLLRAFGTPRVGYARLPQFVGVLNKVSDVRVADIGRGRATIEYRPRRPELRERSPLICHLRRAQLVAGPTLWGLPEARVEESCCQVEGAECCRYEVRWAERVSWAGSAAGLVAGAAVGLLVPHGALLLALTTAVGALGGRLFDLQRQARELKRFNDDQNRALSDAAAAVERRFAELERAKEAVDRIVEERTAELRTTALQLTASLERIEKLAQVKEELLANVSHELRTPLALILGPVEELLAKGPAYDATTARDQLQIVARSAARLDDMVSELLDLARAEAGQLRIAIGPVDLRQLVAGLVEEVTPIARARSLALSFDAGEGTLTVAGDARRLAFVFTNLLSNALKFTPAGGAIAVSVEAAGDGVAVTVRDSGSGISAERQAEIFARWTTFDAGGVGIGLSLVRELVALHGGALSVASKEGEGAAFTVTLPREAAAGAVAAAAERDVALPPTRSRAARPTAPPQPAAPSVAPVDDNRAVVLIVEDDDEMRAYVESVLATRYATESHADVSSALARVAARRPDLIVSDVMMSSGKSGHDLCRALKADPATHLIPIILLTARRSEEWALEGFASGADDYVTKPFGSAELLARVDVQLRLRRLLDEQVQREKLITLGSLAAGLAHEVRNPATAILSGLPRVQRELAALGARPQTIEMLGVAIDCTERISQLVGDLLEVARSESDGEEAQLWDVREGILATARVLAHRTNDRVTVKTRLGHQHLVRARSAALNQVFLNLVDNALSAVGDAGSVEIESLDEPDAVVVLVRDSGPGVPDALRERIFEPFFTTKPIGQGTGLGLHISRRIAYSHRGSLDLVRSTSGGACFRLRLPVANGADPRVTS